MDEIIKAKFNSYPSNIKNELLNLRGLIFQIAKLENLAPINENLKWGQLSYSSPKGSPIRMD
ncbi:hypothetical protein [Alteromonas sp. S015]|uniref:hypothetical protein n=1 Tax=Alteromonas sp. S015 TaxID=3117401 RepID=UPI002FDFDFA9